MFSMGKEKNTLAVAGDRYYVITISCIRSEFHDAGFNMKPAISVNGFPDKQLHF